MLQMPQDRSLVSKLSNIHKYWLQHSKGSGWVKVKWECKCWEPELSQWIPKGPLKLSKLSLNKVFDGRLRFAALRVDRVVVSIPADSIWPILEVIAFALIPVQTSVNQVRLDTPFYFLTWLGLDRKVYLPPRNCELLHLT